MSNIETCEPGTEDGENQSSVLAHPRLSKFIYLRECTGDRFGVSEPTTRNENQMVKL
jgi:hypothetical protein